MHGARIPFVASASNHARNRQNRGIGKTRVAFVIAAHGRPDVTA
jgi:hypothetical protein